MTTQPQIGKWDAALFDRYRAAPEGQLKRMLLGQIVVVNRPLIKILTSQLLGISERRKGLRHSMGRLPGAERLDWEEAENAGMMGFAEAVKRFDPSKGKISFFALHRIRHELQCAIAKETTVYTPRGRESEVNGIAYFDEASELDEAVHRHRAETLDDQNDKSPDPPEGFPEDGYIHLPEALKPGGQANDFSAPAHECHIDSFLENCLTFVRHGRESRIAVLGAYANFMRGYERPPVERVLVQTLLHRGARKITVRIPWTDKPVAGFAGLALRTG